jgi:hypothetical protein
VDKVLDEEKGPNFEMFCMPIAFAGRRYVMSIRSHENLNSMDHMHHVNEHFKFSCYYRRICHQNYYYQTLLFVLDYVFVFSMMSIINRL